MSTPEGSRRSFLRLGVIGAAVAGLAGHVYAWTRSLVPNVLYEPPQKRRLGSVSQFPVGRTFVADHNIFVLRGKDGLRALSAVCPHLGCSVGTQKKGFHCPCHGSKFDADGVNTAGPAPRPLDWHPLSIRGGALIVDLGKAVGPDVVLKGTG